MTQDYFRQVATFVEEDLGFATSHYNDSYLDRRFSSRMRRAGADDYAEYYDILTEDEDEQTEILDALSINVTGFFRNPNVWEGIRELLAELSSENRSIDAWSAACADGREPYSLVLLAHDDPSIDESKLDVLATDINDESLEHARQGAYEDTRTVDLDDQLSFLSNYEALIEHEGSTFQMTEEVRDHITFEHHDLINDRAKSGFDLVMCRNLFIYIDNEFKVPVLESVGESLRDGGYLVIGKAETIPPQLQDMFKTVDSRLRIYQKR